MKSSISTLTPIKAEFLVGLRSSTSGAIFDGGRGTLAWIAAGRYHGYIAAPSMPHSGDTDITGEVAFNERVATVRDNGMANCVIFPPTSLRTIRYTLTY